MTVFRTYKHIAQASLGLPPIHLHTKRYKYIHAEIELHSE